MRFILFATFLMMSSSASALGLFDSPDREVVGACDSWLPADLASANVEAETRLVVTIGTDGLISAPSIIKGSGHPELDDAAAKCVPTLHTQPTLSHGSVIEVRWIGTVKWRPQGHFSVFELPTPIKGYDACGSVYPAIALRNRQRGRAVFNYTIDPDGKVREVSVAVSSGFDALDGAGINCIERWVFPVATTQDGRPVSIDRHSRFIWTLGKTLWDK